MKYVAFTFDGYGLPVAKRLQDEGHEVTVAVVERQKDVLHPLENAGVEGKEAKRRRLALYDGMVKKVPVAQVLKDLENDPRPEETFLYFDLNQLYKFAERLQKRGFPGNYPRLTDFELEIDREKAKEFVKQNYPKLRVAPKQRFNRIAEAQAFLKKSEDLWVLKGLEEDARTVVPDVDDPQLAAGQIMEALCKDQESYESAGFLLELRIANALEFTPQRMWWNGEPVGCFMCIENKPLGAGNVGPQTDCTQDIAFMTSADDKINQVAFPPIIEEMARERRGLFIWDASILVDPRTGAMYFGEFCANRFGYNSIYTEITLAGSATRYFESLVNGESPYEEGMVAVSSRVFNLHRDEKNTPLAGARIEFAERSEQNLWLVDCRRERNRLLSSGYKDTLAVATAASRSYADAAKRAHRAIDDFSFEGSFYRPLFDLTSREYRSSILNRIDYGLSHGYFKVGFALG